MGGGREGQTWTHASLPPALPQRWWLDSVLTGVLDDHAPAMRRRVRPQKSAPWFSGVAGKVRTLKQQRRRAERLWLKTGLTIHKQLYNSRGGGGGTKQKDLFTKLKLPAIVIRSTRVCHVNSCSVWLTNCSETKSHLLFQQSFLWSIFQNAFSTFSKQDWNYQKQTWCPFINRSDCSELSMADPSLISDL